VAQVTPTGWLGCPRCEGCGEEMYVLPFSPDSNRPPGGQFTKAQGARGSYGPRVAEFAAKHEACPEPRYELTAAGVAVCDRRAR